MCANFELLQRALAFSLSRLCIQLRQSEQWKKPSLGYGGSLNRTGKHLIIWSVTPFMAVFPVHTIYWIRYLIAVSEREAKVICWGKRPNGPDCFFMVTKLFSNSHSSGSCEKLPLQKIVSISYHICSSPPLRQDVRDSPLLFLVSLSQDAPPPPLSPSTALRQGPSHHPSHHYLGNVPGFEVAQKTAT